MVPLRRAMLPVVFAGADLDDGWPDVRGAVRYIGVAARPGAQGSRAQVDQVLQMLLPHRLHSLREHRRCQNVSTAISPQFNSIQQGTRTSSSCLAKRLSGCCSSAAAAVAAEVGVEEAAGDGAAAAEDSELTLPLH